MELQPGKTTILLHMGTHKTGSTSLQKSFANNRERLTKAGIRFIGHGGPYRHLYSAFKADPMEYVWNRISGKSVEEIRALDAEGMDLLRQRLRNCQGKVVIISNEYLPMLSREEMSQLRDFLADYGTVHAVYFYRELHSWISSDSQQMAKAGLSNHPTPFGVGLQRVYDFPLRVAEVFGRENTTFIRFEDAIKTGICDTFLSTFDLPTLTALGGVETVENKSVSDAAVAALFAYNRKHPRGSKQYDPEEVERLKQLPGNKYRAVGFTASEIARYKKAHDEVTTKLGLVLDPPEKLPYREEALSEVISRNLRRLVGFVKRLGRRVTPR